MKTHNRILMVTVLGLCGALPALAQSSGAVLMQADRDFARATAQERAEGWMRYMAEDAVIFRAKPLMGKTAIRELYQKVFADADFSLAWEPKKGEMFPSGDLGYTVGRWLSTSAGKDGKKQTQHGTYMTLWKKQADGSWKVVGDIGSADPPR